jgi:hypothetical protein
MNCGLRLPFGPGSGRVGHVGLAGDVCDGSS